MSPRTFVARSAAILSLAALGLAACESKTVVQPPVESLSIVVSPASVTLTAVGQKAQFVAVVTGGTSDQAHTYAWSSSNSAVATVDANGVVTAVANGNASIIATATADQTVKAAGLVTVAIPVTPPTPTPNPPTISIQSVTDNDNHIMDITDVAGQANVNLNVDVPAGNVVTAVQVSVDGNVACQQNFNQSTSQLGVEASNAVLIVCPVNTLKLNANGNPLYMNGPHTISARLVGPNGITAGFPVTQTWIFDNYNVLNLSAKAALSATNPTTHQVWMGGNVTVTVKPAIYGPQGTLNSITVWIDGDSKTVAASSNTDSVVVTFTPANLCCTEDQVDIYAEGATTTGFTGPWSPDTLYMNLDEDPPYINTHSWSGIVGSTPRWLNAMSSLAIADLGPTAADGGVDNITMTLVTAPAADTSSWSAVTTVAALGQKASQTQLFRLTACDALNNCSTAYSPLFGVDLAPPKIVVTSPSAKTNPAGAVNIIAADTGTVGTTVVSGAPTNSLGIKVNVYTATANYCADTLGTTITAMPSAGCTAIAAPGHGTGTNVVLPAAATVQGYDSVVVTAVDSAGNKTTASTKLYLVDTTPPTVGGITFPALVTPGTAVTFSTSAADNVDLGAWTATETFASGFALQVATGTVGTFGKDVFSTTGTPTVVASPFIIGVFADSAAATDPAAVVGFGVSDVAGNGPVANALGIAANMPAATAFTFHDSLGISGWTMTATTPLSLTGATSLPKTANLKATTVVMTGAAQPFSAVYFYARVNGSGLPYVQVATGGAGFATENIINRTYDYSATWTPTVAATYDVIAVALDTKGHALLTPVVPVVVNP